MDLLHGKTMNAIMVCVDYADLLAITLPYNRHHFERVVIVTTDKDEATHKIAAQHNAEVFATQSFYEKDCVFNKWKALEEGLTFMKRYGWICLMDADVLWPENATIEGFVKDNLYTPFRRMYDPIKLPLPAESQWGNYPMHRNIAEWAGYSQIFHAQDKHLGSVPWHETNWKHAGGADSFFQRKWPNDRKLRPSWEVLHLGAAGENWCGRATPYVDDTTHPQANQRREQLHKFRRGRVPGPHRFDHEKT